MKSHGPTAGIAALCMLIAVLLLGVFLYVRGVNIHSLLTSLPFTPKAGASIQKLAIPTQGVLVGVHLEKEGNDSVTQSSITALESQLGRKLAIDSEFENWKPDSEPSGFPDIPRAQWDAQNGRVMMVSWRTDFAGDDPSGGCANAKDIIAGKYDDQLTSQADEVRDGKMPLLVRWHFQMTNNEDDTCFNNNVSVNKDYPTAGQNYVAAWKHIVDIFRKEGASNVEWVWAPSAGLFSNDDGTPNASNWKLFYPGNDYVDWVASDNYNKDYTPGSFADDPDLTNFYNQASLLGKPLMISETGAPTIYSTAGANVQKSQSEVIASHGTNPNAQPGSIDPQTLWIQSAYAALTTKWPAIHAFVYRDGPGDRYILTGTGLNAFKTLANDAHFTTSPQFVNATP